MSLAKQLRRAGAEAVAQESEAKGGRAMGFPCDVTQESHLTSRVQRALEAFGKINVLVNNAGGGAIVNFSSMAGENTLPAPSGPPLCEKCKAAEAASLAAA